MTFQEIDELKLKYFEYTSDQETQEKIIGSLLTDEARLNFMKKFQMPNGYYPDTDYSIVVKSLLGITSDGIKVKFLVEQGCFNYNSYISDYLIADIIKSLSTDEIKLRVLNNVSLLADSYKAKVIASLSTDDAKLRFLEEEKLDIDNNVRAEVIASLSTDDAKLRFLEDEELDIDDSVKAEVIASLSTDDAKLRFLEDKELDIDDSVRAEVIASLSSDEAKLALLYTIPEVCHMDVIISLGQKVKERGVESVEGKLKLLETGNLSYREQIELIDSINLEELSGEKLLRISNLIISISPENLPREELLKIIKLQQGILSKTREESKEKENKSEELNQEGLNGKEK